MKKNLTLRILALTVALLLSVLALAACDAPPGDMVPDLGPADGNTAGGMEGGDSAGSIGNGQPTDNRKIIRTVTQRAQSVGSSFGTFGHSTGA